jgi:antitoxin component YwqK of YwqJK toxin-antitoxin module
MKKLLLFLCFIFSIVFAQNVDLIFIPQHSDAETYYFQSEEGEVGKIVYSKKRSEAINEPHAYRFSGDVRPEAVEVPKKVRKVVNIPWESQKASPLHQRCNSCKEVRYSNQEVFYVYDEYENGKLRNFGRVVRIKAEFFKKEHKVKVIKDLKKKTKEQLQTYPDIILKEGDWEGYYPDGTLQYTQQFSAGRPKGKGYVFYPSGYLKEEYDGRKKVASFNESAKKAIPNMTNYSSSLKLAEKLHKKDFPDNGKGVSLSSQDKKKTYKTKDGTYQTTYEHFTFEGTYITSKSGYEEYVDWYSVNLVFNAIRTRLYEEPDAETRRKTIDNNTYSRYVTKDIENTIKYQIECSNGECELLR